MGGRFQHSWTDEGGGSGEGEWRWGGESGDGGGEEVVEGEGRKFKTLIAQEEGNSWN